MYARFLQQQVWIEATAGTNALASWMHLTTGYNAGYYGYLWSQVFSSDLFTRFQQNGIFDQKTGAELRRCVLEPITRYDGEEMLKAFLGRQPALEPFLRNVVG